MTIFWRNFVTFWVATVLITLISVSMVFVTHHPKRLPPVSLPLPELRACAKSSIEATNAGKSMQIAARCQVVYIMDPSKAELLSSSSVSKDIRPLAAGVTPNAPVRLQAIRREVMIAFDLPIHNSHFVAVAILPPNGFGGPPPFLWWQFAVAAVVSVITCLVLTSRFVDPIRRLQRSTESFGGGNLDARPDASLLDRKDELGDLSKTIGQMATRISLLLSSQKNFLIQVSHELGSPLTRLNVALALARRKASPSLSFELDRIQCESSELSSMVQQLLRLARLESGIEQENQELYSLHKLLLEVCLDNQFTAEQSGKQVRFSSCPQIEIRGYRELLKRALDNILRNAIRFTPEGGRVDVDVLARPDEMVMIQVRDSGGGVQEDKLDAIFEPFVRASPDRSGAGLGLAIAKQAIHANGGTIRAHNLEESGLLIEIGLPYVPSDLAESVSR